MSIENIKGIYPIISGISKEYDEYLFVQFYNEVIMRDDYLSDTYFQIERQLRRGLRTDNIKLFYSNKEINDNNYMTLYIKDRLGQNRAAKVIKKLKSLSNVFEIRINLEYEYHRILFFPYDRDFELVPALIFSYGFTKVNESGATDMTQPLAENTQCIRQSLISEVSNDNLKVGGEFSRGV